MRYIQKMQTGLLLSAILFCFTSTTMAVHSASDSDVTLDDEGKTFQSMSGIDTTQEGALEFFLQDGSQHSAVYAVRPTNPEHETLAECINQAVEVDKRPSVTPYLLVVYTGTGLADRMLHVAQNGLFIDDKTHLVFQAGSVLKGVTDAIKTNPIE